MGMKIHIFFLHILIMIIHTPKIVIHKTQWANRFFFPAHVYNNYTHAEKKKTQYTYICPQMQLRAYRAWHIDISGFFSHTLLSQNVDMYIYTPRQ